MLLQPQNLGTLSRWDLNALSFSFFPLSGTNLQTALLLSPGKRCLPPPHPFFCFLPMPLFTLRPISFAVFTRSCGLNLSSPKDQEIYFPTGSDCEEVDNSLSTISVDVGKGIVGPLWDQEENWNLLKKWGEVIHLSCLNSSVISCCGAREDESELTLLIGSWWNEKGNTSIWMGSWEK